MKDVGSKLLKGKRVILRKLTKHDALAMYTNWCQDQAVTDYVLWEPHAHIKETQEILNTWVKAYDSPWTYRWGIVSPRTGHLVGTIDCVYFSERHEVCELGYCLARDYWNQGMMTEAVELVVRFLFEAVGVNRIEARHATRNPASGRVMIHAGMKKEGTLRQRLQKRAGDFWDLDYYAILREDYYKKNE